MKRYKLFVVEGYFGELFSISFIETESSDPLQVIEESMYSLKLCPELGGGIETKYLENVNGSMIYDMDEYWLVITEV